MGHKEGLQIILLGAPGVGKGTQASMLAKEKGILHISAGDILRQEIKNKTFFGVKAQSFVSQGMLVPDELITDIIKSRLNENDCLKGFVLDGYPRTIEQAKALDGILDGLKKEISAVINIEVADNEIIERLTGRRICENCKENYHIKFKPSRKNNVCDVCGGKLIIREDDKEETIKKRLAVYRSMTRPLIQYYRDRNLLSNVSGVGEIAEIKNKIGIFIDSYISGKREKGKNDSAQECGRTKKH